MKKNIYLVKIYDINGHKLAFERMEYTRVVYAVKAVQRLVKNSLYKASLNGEPFLFAIWEDNNLDSNGMLVESGFFEA